jgi:DNA helicase IV
MTRNRIMELLASINPQAETRCRVMTPAEARGLEFDHVLVAYVDHGNYPKTEKYGAALYVACTRATATLTCTYFGSASGWLPTSQDN